MLDIVNEVLKTGGFASQEEAIRDFSLLIALAKKSRYEGECKAFESKYRMTFKEFKRKLTGKKNKENFEEEDDLMDWQFSYEALLLWEERVRRLKNAEAA